MAGGPSGGRRRRDGRRRGEEGRGGEEGDRACYMGIYFIFIHDIGKSLPNILYSNYCTKGVDVV